MSLKLTNTVFEGKAKQIHGDKYEYYLVEYLDSQTKVKIFCREHGVFEQKPNDHLQGRGCKKCGYKNRDVKKLTTKTFIQKANKIHKEEYDYSEVFYEGSHEKVNIICDIHGSFSQKPNNHLNGQGCPKCAIILRNYYNLTNAENFKNKFKNEKAIVYLINIFSKEENFYKIGITTTTLHYRFGDLVKYYDYNQVEIIDTNLYDAILLENKILTSKNNNYKPKHKIKGYTECFSTIPDYFRRKNSDEEIFDRATRQYRQ